MVNYKAQLIIALIVMLETTVIQCGKYPWKVTYDADKQEYIGMQERFPHESNSFRNYYIHVLCKNGSYDGYDVNGYADGNMRPLGTHYAKKYFEKFKKLHDLETENADVPLLVP
jgi:hypothetical protein